MRCSKTGCINFALGVVWSGNVGFVLCPTHLKETQEFVERLIRASRVRGGALPPDLLFD